MRCGIGFVLSFRGRRRRKGGFVGSVGLMMRWGRVLHGMRSSMKMNSKSRLYKKNSLRKKRLSKIEISKQRLNKTRLRGRNHSIKTLPKTGPRQKKLNRTKFHKRKRQTTEYFRKTLSNTPPHQKNPKKKTSQLHHPRQSVKRPPQPRLLHPQ